jgi:ribonuclease HI
MTSFQANGHAVVDYILLTAESVATVRAMNADVDRAREWSDHAALSVELDLPIAPPPAHAHPAVRMPAPSMPRHPVLDAALERALAARQTPEEALDDLYGTCRNVAASENVYTDGSCMDTNTASARAGAGIYWGHGSVRNGSRRVPGEQTNNNAEMYAVAEALRRARPDYRLLVFSDSTYVIRLLCYSAPRLASEGWTCVNATVIKTVVARLQNRTAPVEFIHVRSHTGNEWNDAADALAKAGCDRALISPDLSHEAQRHTVPGEARNAELGWVPKVSTTLPRLPERREEPPSRAELMAELDEGERNAHRGRAKARLMKRRNLAHLLDVSARNERTFWDLVRRWADPKKRAPAVSLDALNRSLQQRMTLGERDPRVFDVEELRMNARIADGLPSRTEDRTAEQFFSKAYELSEMEALKISRSTSERSIRPRRRQEPTRSGIETSWTFRTRLSATSSNSAFKNVLRRACGCLRSSWAF